MAISTSDARTTPADVSTWRFAVLLAVIVLVAASLRFMFPVADPPTQPTVGIVWHDEGAWVHNARNRALFGAWTTDEWNPLYITPVLTGLEYVSFREFGVGLRQARLVPEVLGIVSVLLLGLGVAAVANRLAGLMAAALLATHFVYVMYNRAATIEATMVAFLVVSWYGYARAGKSPRWGLLAGCAAIVAYFTKASAVFFVGALALDALASVILGDRRRRTARPLPATGPSPGLVRRAGAYTLAGLTLAGIVSLVVFVLPYWHEYRFYNWQISVTRKPVYTIAALVARASWLPVSADFFTRMWPVLVVSLVASLGRLAVVGRLAAAERLLLWWIGLGIAELVAHDVQERRLTLLIPPMIAMAAIALGRDRSLVPAGVTAIRRRHLLMVSPLVVYTLYLLGGALARLPFLASSSQLSPGVRAGALVAVVAAVIFYARSRRVVEWLAGQRCTARVAVLFVALVVAGDLAQVAQWAAVRTYKNYDAMLLIGRWLPPGTLVHGKLANGLDLENGIRPVFVGRGFGNYEDRRRRDDVRYVVTYVSPFVGYEGGRDTSGRSIIQDVLDTYPNRRLLHVFDVAESPFNTDAAILVDKRPEPRNRAEAAR